MTAIRHLFVYGSLRSTAAPRAQKSLLGALDEYEGFLPDDPQGSLYLRVSVPVALAEGRSLECWAYAYNRDVTGLEPIGSGDYLKR